MKKIMLTTLLLSVMVLPLISYAQTESQPTVVRFSTNEKTVMLLNLINQLNISTDLKTRLISILFTSSAIETVDSSTAGEVQGVATLCVDADCGIGDGAKPLHDDSEKKVIRAGDNTGKMIGVVGGDTGRELLSTLIKRQSDPSITQYDRVVASVMQQILLQRWFEIEQN